MYFKMGSQYGRVLFLKDYASYIKDSMILELTDLNRRMMLSIDMIPVPTDEAVREVENKLLGVETNVTNWQRRQNSNQNFSAVVPYDLEQQRKELLNGNGFILGVSGSGKSFAAKREITEIALSTNDDIIIIDPEAEYRPLVEGLGGEVIEISATSPNHINALDMESGDNDGDNPVVLKSEFLLSLCEQLVGAGKLSAKEKSIIDRCTAQVYREFMKG